MEELRPGLWTWTASHPSWTPEDGGPEGWEQEVRSYALDAGDSVVLFDPLVDAAAVAELADRRPVVVLLTCHWHRRSAGDLMERLGAVVHAPPTQARDLDITFTPYGVGDDLPGDVEPYAAGYDDECTLWIRGHQALVTGDVFLGGQRGFRVQPDSWLADGLTHDGLRERLRPLLELPIGLLLPTHGDPVADDARGTLERALSA
jgi:glyoxylase-like metal-dependent hydrolase (beta-lactamase superfamily II)